MVSLIVILLDAMRKPITATVLLFILLASCLIIIQPIRANSTIIVPDDYPTITDAIGNATDGDSIFIRKGTYNEKFLETNKTLSIIGEGAEITKIDLQPPSHQVINKGLGMNGPYVENITVWNNSVKIYANDTKISSITISSPGTAYIVGERIQITKSTIAVPILSIVGSYSNIVENMISAVLTVNGSYSRIEENSINELQNLGSYVFISKNSVLGDIGVKGKYCRVSANNVSNIRLLDSYCEISLNDVRGINIEASSCFVHDNNGGTVRVAGDENIVARNLLVHGGYGVELSGSSNVIYANIITNNTIGIVESGKSNKIYANCVADNFWGVDTGYNGITAILYYNNFVDNRYQVSTNFPVNKIDYFDNGTIGNYWSNYNGTDLNGDGLGDISYLIDSTRSDRYPLMAPFDIDNIIVSVPEWVNNIPTPQPLPTMLTFPTSSPAISPSPSIPEIPPWKILPFLLVITLGAVLIVKKKKEKIGS